MKRWHTKKVLSGERHASASVLGPEWLCLSSYDGFFMLVHWCPNAPRFSLNFHLCEIKRLFFWAAERIVPWLLLWVCIAGCTDFRQFYHAWHYFPYALGGSWAFSVSHPPLMLYFSLKITVIITPLFSDRGQHQVQTKVLTALKKCPSLHSI